MAHLVWSSKSCFLSIRIISCTHLQMLYYCTYLLSINKPYELRIISKSMPRIFFILLCTISLCDLYGCKNANVKIITSMYIN